MVVQQGLSDRSTRASFTLITPSASAAVGFTLIELLVVTSIVSILIAILLPALGSARRSAQRVVCANQTRQHAIALRLYATDNRDWLPPNSNGNSGDMPAPFDSTYRFTGAHLWAAYLGMHFVNTNANISRTSILVCGSDDVVPRYDLGGTAAQLAAGFPSGKIYSSYGMNSYYTRPKTEPNASYGNWAKYTSARNPTGTLLLSEMHEKESDGSFRNAAVTWESNLSAPNLALEFRHQESVNVAYFDGHADVQNFNTLVLDVANPNSIPWDRDRDGN